MADTYYQKAIQEINDNVGANHPLNLIVNEQMAFVHFYQGKTAESVIVLERSL